MAHGLRILTFNYNDKRKRGEGLRIGTTRRPPRGQTKLQWKKHFDVWFPVVAPSGKLLKRYRQSNAMTFEDFCASYERELTSRAESRQTLVLLAELARRTTISIGCYCDDEKICHRSFLKQLIMRHAS